MMKLVINGKAVSIDNPGEAFKDFGVVTEAEYENLSDEQKANGMWYVPDEPAEETEPGFSNIYSTEEIVVGRWIDGKPIYRKVFYGLSKAGWNVTFAKTTDLNIETVVKFDGTLKGGGAPDGAAYPLNYNATTTATSDTFLWKLYCLMIPGEIRVGASRNLEQNCPMHVILEYTKTTDEATIDVSRYLKL